MNNSMLAGLCAVAGLMTGAAASAAQPYHREPLPPLYVVQSAAQAACPTDQVLWVNWVARKSHVPGDRWYAATKTGAYACAQPSAAVGIQPGGAD
ncbi:MAG TPA: hypothetical protein VGV37_27250 [Aliidongia sp.]|uniref:hypothetical protein n=1 Tax=Aliidongia sp. TaxID=1914230 RepID=UPI002DDD1815|nr:hypothetical protein [Aliidongia sp.]HEV2678255.1 hypothetical protein [Aliidongia sp.]